MYKQEEFIKENKYIDVTLYDNVKIKILYIDKKQVDVYKNKNIEIHYDINNFPFIILAGNIELEQIFDSEYEIYNRYEMFYYTYLDCIIRSYKFYN